MAKDLTTKVTQGKTVPESIYSLNFFVENPHGEKEQHTFRCNEGETRSGLLAEVSIIQAWMRSNGYIILGSGKLPQPDKNVPKRDYSDFEPSQVENWCTIHECEMDGPFAGQWGEYYYHETNEEDYRRGDYPPPYRCYGKQPKGKK